jgi:hypothetical protein
VNTPDLDFKSFTIAMEFKLQSTEREKSNIPNSGTSYRWFGLNNKSPRAVSLPAEFRLEVVSEPGLVDELTIFDGVFTKKEFEDLRGSLEH